MNRVIKFRAFHIASRSFFDATPFTEGHIMLLGTPGTMPVPSNEYVLQQWTGFTDRSGKEVFEGDVIIKNNQPFVIAWIDGAFMYAEMGKGKKAKAFYFREKSAKLCQVIGKGVLKTEQQPAR